MLGLAGQGAVESLILERAVFAQTASRVSLKLRKEPKHLDVMLAGIGDRARVVQERSTNTSWRGKITRSDDGGSTKEVAQQLAMPEIGVASVRLRGSGSNFELEVTSVAGTVLPKPQVLATGEDLVLRFVGLVDAVHQTGAFDLRRPARIPQRVSAPPLRSRAVAPPLGDMAVGSMLMSNRSFVQASGPPVTLTLNNAPAKDALMSLARLGGYGFVYVGSSELSGQQDGGGSEQSSVPFDVTMSFRGESYAKALNSVLMASGLQGKLDGRILLVGREVAFRSFSPQMSKVFRLNQVQPGSAANYLANLGAQISVTNTQITESEQSSSQENSSNDSSESSETTTTTRDIVETYGAFEGPLVGLTGTTDSRLGTITLIGEPQLISVAESYLKQLDLRKRQVAVKVQILNVSLDNDSTIDSSFSAKIGNTFIVSQSGKAHMNFGAYKPGGPSLGAGTYNGSEYVRPGTYPSYVPRVQAQDARSPYIVAQKEVINPVFNDDGKQIGQEKTFVDVLDEQGRPKYIKDTNPNAEKTLVPQFDKNGRPVYVNASDPSKFEYPDNSFYSYLESVIISSSSKTLAQPTLLVQEGEKALVRSGESVITGVSKTEASNGSSSFSNTRQDAGLTVNLEVEKIDDNGFVTLKLDPTISVPVSAGQQEGVQIFNIVKRELNSGRIRLRDRQTLILTGVITDSDRQLARKWPILGDLPLIGQLFRSSSSNRQKNELVIIVTPSVLDDDNGGAYGYGYKPGTTEATRLIGSGSERY